MGSKSRAKWKQKLMKDKGLTFRSKKILKEQIIPASARKAEKLLKEAEEFLETFDYESARECCRKALRFDGSNIKALELTASISLDLGDPDTAHNMLLEAVRVSPEVGYVKYFSLGQLADGQDSLRHYEKGIEIATKALEENKLGASKSENTSNVQREISNAYCAIADIYMTDLCFEHNAEAQCKDAIETARQTDPSNPETFQCLANFQLTTGQTEEAQKSMADSLALWLPKYRSLREGQLEAGDPAQDCPLSYDTRMNTGKLLIELEMFDEAAEVFDGLLDEDDEVVDVWYLLGWSNYLRGEEYRGNARFYLTKAKEVSQKAGDTDNEQMEHIEHLLEELGPDLEDEDKENNDDVNNDSNNSEDEEMEQT